MKSAAARYWKPMAAITFWGISFIATKVALAELAPREIILCRQMLGAAFLFILAVATRKKFSVTFKNLKNIFLLSLIAVFHLWIQVTGMQYTTASNTGWIIGITPVFMALLGFFFFKENLSFIRISGIIIAFAGLLLLITKGDSSNLNLIKNKGDFLVLGSAFTWSVYSIVNKKISLNYSPLLTILFLFLMMAVIIAPFTITNSFVTKLSTISSDTIFAVLFLGIFSAGVAYVLWAQSLVEMDSATVGAFLYFEPFVTVIGAWIILNEQITLLIMLSGVIITLGVVLVNVNLKSLFKRIKKPRTSGSDK